MAVLIKCIRCLEKDNKWYFTDDMNNDCLQINNYFFCSVISYEFISKKLSHDEWVHSYYKKLKQITNGIYIYKTDNKKSIDMINNAENKAILSVKEIQDNYENVVINHLSDMMVETYKCISVHVLNTGCDSEDYSYISHILELSNYLKYTIKYRNYSFFSYRPTIPEYIISELFKLDENIVEISVSCFFLHIKIMETENSGHIINKILSSFATEERKNPKIYRYSESLVWFVKYQKKKILSVE